MAAALINFCEAIERDMLLPYLDKFVVRLLRKLNLPAPEDQTPRPYGIMCRS